MEKSSSGDVSQSAVPEKADSLHSNTARERWKILKLAISSAACRVQHSSHSPTSLSSSSVRAFTSFCLFHVSEPQVPPAVTRQEESVPVCPTDPSVADPNQSASETLATDPIPQSVGRWFRYQSGAIGDVSCPVTERIFHTQVLTRVLTGAASLQNMMGFNNTGNVCIWPSEEVLAYYCLRNSDVFRDKSVCELGCGMSALAGVMLAATQLPTSVLLTDGNKASVANVQTIVSVNANRFGNTRVCSELLRWEPSFLEVASAHDSKYDWIICADCLFFDGLHLSLVKTMLKLLKPWGKVLILAPKRSGTMDTFVSIAQDVFEVQIQERYDEEVWKRHNMLVSSADNDQYKPDLHFPVLLTLHIKH